ncbi:MAG TPA: efflux transporter outer membrane subunit [Stellaceae bacterium]|nr:efflux transporter outer membrane subunit [Stellaceae bacterium]
MSRAARLAAATTMLLLGGCVVGPDYHRPPADVVPAVYKEAKGWQAAVPSDAMNRGAWWEIYNDPVLDRLERRVAISNQNLQAAEAAYREATAIVAEARAQYFPTVTANASATRSRTPTGASGAAAAAAGVRSGVISNAFALNEAASWTPDIWGKIHRLVEENIATAQASAGDLASARLSAQGELASDYLQLRVADELKRLLAAAVVAYKDSLRITQNQYRAGTADESAVAQAQAQLDSTQAQLIGEDNTRAALEHAIAVLIGEPPADLTIAPTTTVIAIPEIPAGFPCALLERRPDIAAAERQMAAANAQIGVAAAAFFPDITLSAQSGVESSMLSNLFTAPSRAWSFGGNLVQTVFDGGLNQATLQQYRAAYDETVANYRETVLTAFQQVEDELAAQRILADEAKVQDAAVAAAREAERVINNQYLAGTVAYTSVIVAEETALADAESAVNIRQSRLVASTALIQALGGGWATSQLPTPVQVERQNPLNFSPVPPSDTWPKFLRFWEL